MKVMDKSIFVFKRVLVSLFFLFITCQAASALEVAGVKVPENISIDESGTQLVLNGAGIRKKFFIKIYVGSLYLQTKQNKVDAILADTGPKRITMHFLYKEVSAESLVDGWNEGFTGNNSAEVVKSLQDRINRFNKLFRTVKKGDVIRLDYLPEKGTQVLINDKLMGTVEGNDFNQAILKIWLGKKPADDGLKKAWLGKR
jgi:hypothetical protein